MRRYGKKKHAGFYCQCRHCTDEKSPAERMTWKRRARREGRADAFDAWQEWFRENCSEWDQVEDIEAELGRDKE
jgi:hypothetical protein